LSDSILKRIPIDYREEANNLLTATDGQQRRLDKISDSELQAFAITALSHKPKAADFLLRELETEPSGDMRAAILQGLGRYWLSHPDARKILESHAGADKDPNVLVKALEALRLIRMMELKKLLDAGEEKRRPEWHGGTRKGGGTLVQLYERDHASVVLTNSSACFLAESCGSADSRFGLW
jgi:hypothetical protein